MNSYIFDTHVHTSETSPCGKIDGAMVSRLYKNAGYHGIVITDHYYDGYFNSLKIRNWEDKVEYFLQGYRNAYKEGQKIGLNVLLGIEIRFTENFNDYLVYGIDEEFLVENPMLYKLGLREFKKLIKGTDALIYQAHPYRLLISPANPQYLDGVEVFNGNPRHNSRNHRALKFANENNLKMISGSDFHQNQDLAIGGIILPENPETSIEFSGLLNDNRIIELISEKQNKR